MTDTPAPHPPTGDTMDEADAPSPRGLSITRRFTEAGRGPYVGISWETRTARICNADGSVVFEGEARVPSTWSQGATNVLAQKYMRKAGVPFTTQAVVEPGIPLWCARRVPAKGAIFGGEHSADDVFGRLAGAWTYWGLKGGYFASEADAHAFYDEIRYMLAHQMCAPNSPQWFNTGLHWAYGIEQDTAGYHHADPDTGDILPTSPGQGRINLSACYILSVEDDLVGEGGIMDLWLREARLFRYGSGAGGNFSKIRGKNEPLSGGGVSSGLMSFLRVGDTAAGAIKSGGTSRRAAKLICLDLDHPDIESFITWKQEESRKVACLVAGAHALQTHGRAILQAAAADDATALASAIAAAHAAHLPAVSIRKFEAYGRQGYTDLGLPDFDTDWQGEAYQTISGQNANNSVRIPHAFFDALDDDAVWTLTWRTDGQVCRGVPARELWDAINEAAWDVADPGLQFPDTINGWNTCSEDGEIRGSNPCSEYMFLDDTACNLASLNLLAFYDPETGEIRLPDYLHAIRLWTIVLDISVSASMYPSAAIAKGTRDYRTLGLGYANLGALLMSMGLPYDSDEGRAVAGALTAILTGHAYTTSAEMALHLGAFPRYATNRESMLRVIDNHRRAACGAHDGYEGLPVPPVPLGTDHGVYDLYIAAMDAWRLALAAGKLSGYRNAQVSVLAPCGTIGLVMDCDTTGIEPDFALVKSKQLAGGGVMRIVNRSVPRALQRLGYAEDEIEEINAYITGRGTLDGAVPRALGTAERLCLEAVIQVGAYDLDYALHRAKLTVDDLGLTQSELNALRIHVWGAGTIEGAPHLLDEHLPVFDCANLHAPGGRFIAPEGHIQMMAACQPFLSGAISKTVNAPNHSTIADIASLHRLAWELGLKAIAVYRDGSKLSQPLSSAFSVPVEVLSDPDPIKATAEALADAVVQRRLLPNRRQGWTQKVRVGGHKLYLRTGQYEDGTLGEIFVDLYKEGAAFRALANAFAVAISTGLQYGVPLERFVETFVGTRFEPNGMVEGSDRLMMATSILDYIFRELAVAYLGWNDLAHVQPEDLDPGAMQGETPPQPPPARADPLSEVDRARRQGYTGDACAECGALAMVRNGVCHKCANCGATSGCS